MEEEKYLSVKDFAEAAGVSKQYIYKILDTHLKPYKKRIDKRLMIEAAAVELVKIGFAAAAEIQQEQPKQQTNSTDTTEKTTETTAEATNTTASFVDNSTDFSTNSTDTTAAEIIEALKEFIEELKRDKEELKRDKEDLKQELLKWQQLLIDERNKVKLLEAAQTATREERVYYAEPFEDIKEPAAAPAPAATEKEAEPQSFLDKLKWLFFSK